MWRPFKQHAHNPRKRLFQGGIMVRWRLACVVGMCVHTLKTCRFISLLQGQVPLCFAFIKHQGTWFSIPRMVRDVAPSSTCLSFLLHGGSAPPSAWPQLVPFSTHVPHLPGAYILAFSLEGTLCPTNSEPIPQFLESQKPSFNLLTWTFTQKRDRISPRRGTNWFLPTAPRCQAEQQLYQCSGPISTLKALDQALGLSLPQFPTCKTDLSIFLPLQSSGG